MTQTFNTVGYIQLKLYMRSSDLTSASFRDDDVTVTDSRSIQLVFAPSGNICPSEAQFSRAMHLALST